MCPSTSATTAATGANIIGAGNCNSLGESQRLLNVVMRAHQAFEVIDEQQQEKIENASEEFDVEAIFRDDDDAWQPNVEGSTD